MPASIEGIARSLKAGGFRTICFIADHGGSQAPQAETIARLNAEWAGKGIRVVHVDAYYADARADRAPDAAGRNPRRHRPARQHHRHSELMAVHPRGVDLGRLRVSACRCSRPVSSAIRRARQRSAARSCWRSGSALRLRRSDRNGDALNLSPRPFTSPLASHDVGTLVVALCCVAFSGKNVEACGRYMLAQLCCPKDTGHRALGRSRASRAPGQPDEGVHIPEARCLGDEQAFGCKQGVDAAQRAGQVADQMEIVESQNCAKLHGLSRQAPLRSRCGRQAPGWGRRRVSHWQSRSFQRKYPSQDTLEHRPRAGAPLFLFRSPAPTPCRLIPTGRGSDPACAHSRPDPQSHSWHTSVKPGPRNGRRSAMLMMGCSSQTSLAEKCRSCVNGGFQCAALLPLDVGNRIWRKGCPPSFASHRVSRCFITSSVIN